MVKDDLEVSKSQLETVQAHRIRVAHIVFNQLIINLYIYNILLNYSKNIKNQVFWFPLKTSLDYILYSSSKVTSQISFFTALYIMFMLGVQDHKITGILRCSDILKATSLASYLGLVSDL